MCRFRMRLTALLLFGLLLSFTAAAEGGADGSGTTGAARLELFTTADRCQACHNGLTDGAGRDLSIGSDWSASMMANSARDPYWHAAVRREVTDHPTLGAAIEDECSKCHMPMARFAIHTAGGQGPVFDHLGPAPAAAVSATHALDGASCTLCHQIQPDKLGERESFVGGFVIDTATPPGQRKVFGPYDVDAGRQRLMRSASRFEQGESTHVQGSELCATCHTLFTHAYGPDGKVIGELPEQVPYLEWQHSAYDGKQDCQDCHMLSTENVAMSSVWGQPRDTIRPHVFRGGNFLMLRMLAGHRVPQQVQASPRELGAAAERTVEHLQSSSADVSLSCAGVSGGRLEVEVTVTNLAGHKLPTAYPSRRAWLHLTVTDAADRLLFESGMLQPDGAIAGNDNDADPARYEPHHPLIDQPDKVQIYEAILGSPDGTVTTGLLTATRYLKDNRLLPRGFDAKSASANIAVQGAATTDADFTAEGDRIRYSVAVGDSEGPYRVRAELLYQSIGYRWAHNLAPYDAAEPQRFVAYYREAAGDSAVSLASQEILVGAGAARP